MPAKSIASFAAKSGKSQSEVESLWQKAKARAAEQGHSEDWPYIVGILKRSLGLKEEVLCPVSELETLDEDGAATAAPAASTTSSAYPIIPPAGGNPAKKKKYKRQVPDFVIYGYPGFDVNESDFIGMSRARVQGTRYQITNEKVKTFMRESNYAVPYIIKFGENILKIGKHMAVAK